MTDAEILIAVALASEGAQESPAGSNKGVYVERLQKQAGVDPGSPWCACGVLDWGLKALGTRWPLPHTAGCAVLAEFAKAHNVLMDTPEVGDVFLIWEKSLGRFGHTGLVIGLPNLTISGNTTRAGQAGDPREGWVVAKKPWRNGFAPEDRFIRWTSLLK